MIRLGQVLVFAGILTMFVPLPHHLGVVVGLVVIGFGCAPIYPCVIHSTPAYFGEDKSQAIVGVQMACAYVGSLLMPPLFGIIRAICDNQSLPVVFAGALGADGGHARASSQVARLIICAFGPVAYYAWSPW